MSNRSAEQGVSNSKAEEGVALPKSDQKVLGASPGWEMGGRSIPFAMASYSAAIWR